MTATDFTPWPPEVATAYRQYGYWQGQTLGDWFTERVARHADRIAVSAPAIDEDLTYRDLDQRAHRLARRLSDSGLRPGDRVILQLPNRPVFLVALVALFRAGVIPVLALPAHRATELIELARTSEAVGYLVADLAGGEDHRDLARALVARSAVRTVLVAGDPGEFTALEGDDNDPVTAAPVPAEVVASAVAFLNLSGGSTGTPKLIPRTHDDYLYSVRASAEICELDTTTTYLCVLPAAHNFSLSSPGLLGVLHAGGRIVMTESPEPAVCFELIETERVTFTALVPPLAKLWLESAASRTDDLSSLQTIQVGGARLSETVARRIPAVLGCRVQQVFGMAEGLVNYTRFDDPGELVMTTQGRPISPHDEIRVVDGSGSEVPDGEVGELLTRGPYTIRGYFRAPEHNRRTFTADGFFRTGDLVRRLPSGHLVVEGRVKDQINRGGEKIAVDEVENLLLRHPAVFDAVVVGVPDEVLGQRSCAIVVPRSGETELTAAEVRRHVRSCGVAAYKVPDLVELVSELPVTAVGKTSRVALRAELEEWLAAGDAGTGRSDSRTAAPAGGVG